MIIELVGGLTSRLDCLASCVNSIHYPERIKLVWKPDLGINASFDNLFENDIKFHDLDKKWFQIYTYQVGKHFDPRFESTENEWWIVDWPPIFEDTGKYGNFRSRSNKHPFNRWFSTLKPQKHLQGIIDEYSSKIIGHRDTGTYTYPTYGINIRRGTGLNYHPHSTILSPISLFINKIKAILEVEHDARFIVTTDSYYDLDQLCLHYYDRLIFVKEYMDFPLDDGYTLNGMKRTVIDWFLLQKAKKIFCTNSAGFAHRAARVANIELEELTTQNPAVLNYFTEAINRRMEKKF